MEIAEKTQRETQEGATHEETRAENDKDTRAIEAQYLSRGLAERVLEWQQCVSSLETSGFSKLSGDAAAAVGALITVADEDENEKIYLLAPDGAGLKIRDKERTVLVVTKNAPIGKALLGARLDDEIVVKSPSGPQSLTVLSIE